MTTSVRSMGKTLQDSGVGLGVLLLPISGAFNPLNLFVFFVTSVSVLIYIASKHVFSTSEIKDHPEAGLDRAGHYFSVAAVTLCFIFNIFLLAERDLAEALSTSAGDAVRSELSQQKDKGFANVVDLGSGVTLFQKQEMVIGIIDHNAGDFAGARSVFFGVFRDLFGQMHFALKYLFFYTIIVSGFVFVITWFGKSVIRPVLNAFQAGSAPRAKP